MLTIPFLIFKQPILHLTKRYAAATVISLETNGSEGRGGNYKPLFYTSKALFFCLLDNSVGTSKLSQRTWELPRIKTFLDFNLSTQIWGVYGTFLFYWCSCWYKYKNYASALTLNMQKWKSIYWSKQANKK